MRLFVSADLDVTDELRPAQTPFEPLGGVRVVDPEQVHFTLKFLGETDDQRIEAVETALTEAINAAHVAPFDAAVGGYGVFPSPEYISVIWVGVRKGSEQLHRLQEAIERRMVDLGFDPADHEFTPHATIAHMDHAAEKTRVQTIIEQQHPDLGTTHIDRVQLTESTLTPHGPEHRTVHTVGL